MLTGFSKIELYTQYTWQNNSLLIATGKIYKVQMLVDVKEMIHTLLPNSYNKIKH